MKPAQTSSLNLLLLAVGTHGDIQPFIAIGRKLQAAGHRVRLATHATMRALVERHALEFYPLGGDPRVLAEFAAESRGVFPRSPMQVRKVRKQVKAYLMPQLAACTERDPQRPGLQAFQADAIVANPISYGGPHLADHLGVPLHYLFTMPYSTTSEFPHPQARFLHEKRFQLSSKWEGRMAPLLRGINRESYTGVFNAMFMGVIDIIDDFRRHVLRTDSIYCLKGYNALFEPAPFRHGITGASINDAPAAAVKRRQVAPAADLEEGLQPSPSTPLCGVAGAANPEFADRGQGYSTAASAQQHAPARIRGARDAWAPGWSAPVPRSYCFSPSLVPRPADWPGHVNAVGFCRDPDAGDDSSYVPPPELERFLAAGPKPVYIGFGSMAIKDPEAVTRTVLAALKETGLRAVIGKGWGGLGMTGEAARSPLIHVVDHVPHGWLLPRCAAAVHHGGAGTTAASTAAGIPTGIVPFFGDQPYWGGMCWRMGVGPSPVAIQKLTKARLVEQLRVLVQPEVAAAAARLGAQMQMERDGAEVFVDVLHKHLQRWQQHCGAGSAKEGATPARYCAPPLTAAAQLPAAAVTGNSESPARPSDSSSSLATLVTMAAAHESELASFKAQPGLDRLDDNARGERSGVDDGSESTRNSPAASVPLSPASSAAGADEVLDPELLDAMEQGWQYGQPNRVHSATERRLYARKSTPKLSWWVEGALAMGHITMLGVMSTMPCKTTFKQRKGGQLT